MMPSGNRKLCIMAVSSWENATRTSVLIFTLAQILSSSQKHYNLSQFNLGKKAKYLLIING
jgi:hypothetical protein